MTGIDEINNSFVNNIFISISTLIILSLDSTYVFKHSNRIMSRYRYCCHNHKHISRTKQEKSTGYTIVINYILSFIFISRLN